MAEDQENLYIKTFQEIELTGNILPLSAEPVPKVKLNRPEPGVFYENDLDSPTTHFRDTLRMAFLNNRTFLCLITPDKSVLYSDSPDVTHFNLNPNYQRGGSSAGFYSATRVNPLILEILIRSPKIISV